MTIRTVIVHHDKKKLWALEKILSDDKALTVVAVFEKSDEALKFITTQLVNIVVISDTLADQSGCEFIISIMRIKPVPCLLLTESDTVLDDEDARALDYGIVDTHEIEYFNSTIIHGARIKIKVKILSKLKLERFHNLIEQVNLADDMPTIAGKGEVIALGDIKTSRESDKGKAKVETKIVTWISKPSSELISSVRRYDSLVVLGASTGGPSLLDYLISQLPQVFPPVIVIQHMPKGFVSQFASRLNSHSKINVKMAEEGDRVIAGNVYVAPGGNHLEFKRLGKGVMIHISDGPKVNYVKPAVDVTLRSAAEIYGSKVIVAILTGMGSDGTDGAKRIKQKGGTVIALNEADSSIYGMNKSVIEAGFADVVSSKNEMVQNIIRFLLKNR